MDLSKKIYLVFLTVSFILSVVCKKKEKGLFIFPFLLSVTLLVEFCEYLLWINHMNSMMVYHFYLPVEYCLWIIYFYSVIDDKMIKKLAAISIPVYAVFSLFASIRITGVESFPQIQLNIEGILLIIIAIYTIFTIRIDVKRSIFARPVFWVSIAVFVFYSISFPLTAVYEKFALTKDGLTILLRLVLLIIPNLVLYTCLSIAFICSHRIKN